MMEIDVGLQRSSHSADRQRRLRCIQSQWKLQILQSAKLSKKVQMKNNREKMKDVKWYEHLMRIEEDTVDDQE
jgi:hypothetical protein